jgi:hypothetical protein
VNVKKIGVEAAIVSALGFTAVGMSSGIASADQLAPTTPGAVWKLDHGHGHWHGDRDGDDWNDGWYGGPAWQPAPCGAAYWVPPAVSQWVPPAAWGC